MSQNSKKPSGKSETHEAELQTSAKLMLELEKELQKLRSELTTLKKEKPSSKKETDKLESTIGTVLLDLAEEIPLAGRAVKWFRNWMRT